MRIMKKTFAPLALVVLLAACAPLPQGSGPSASSSAVDAPTRVHRQGDTIVYTGPLSDAANRQVAALLDAHTTAELMEALGVAEVDAPLCMTCGTKMRPSGSCYVCEGCGSTSGCS